MIYSFHTFWPYDLGIHRYKYSNNLYYHHNMVDIIVVDNTIDFIYLR